MAVVTLILWLGYAGQAILVRANHVNDTDSNPNSNPTSNPTTKGLSEGLVTAIVAGSVAGVLILVLALGLLIRCICQRRKVTSNSEPKPGSHSAPNTQKPVRLFSSSAWTTCMFPKGSSSCNSRVPMFHSKPLQDGDDEWCSDASFVLPELGGPNPHNKFDGMEWVDIKRLDGEVLVDISTDLRKYQTQQQQQQQQQGLRQ